jgi:predicted enzyme related to lactoylglutathione lyase
MISKSLSTAVMVRDAKKSAKWYKQKLGFNASVDEYWTTVWPKGATSKLHLCEGKLEPGNTGIGIYCDDVKKVASQLKERGVEFSKNPKDEGWGMYAMFKDPDGNEFWLLKGGP